MARSIIATSILDCVVHWPPARCRRKCFIARSIWVARCQHGRTSESVHNSNENLLTSSNTRIELEIRRRVPPQLPAHRWIRNRAAAVSILMMPLKPVISKWNYCPSWKEAKMTINKLEKTRQSRQLPLVGHPRSTFALWCASILIENSTLCLSSSNESTIASGRTAAIDALFELSVRADSALKTALCENAAGTKAATIAKSSSNNAGITLRKSVSVMNQKQKAGSGRSLVRAKSDLPGSDAG